QLDVAADDAALALVLGGGADEAGAVAEVAAQRFERGGGGEDLGVRGGVEEALAVVRIEQVAVAGVHHGDADAGARERLLVEDVVELAAQIADALLPRIARIGGAAGGRLVGLPGLLAPRFAPR